MPYHLERRKLGKRRGWIVVTTTTGFVHSDRPLSRPDAERQMAALYAAMGDEARPKKFSVIPADREIPPMPTMSPSIEHKTFSAYEIKATDRKAGILEAVVAVFSNVDRGKDRILPGFFSKSLRQKLPKGVWMHDWKVPVAKTLEARELLPGDPSLPEDIRSLGGLYIKGQFNLDTQRGREAFSDIDFGAVDEFSIGYETVRDKVDSKTGVRDLIEGNIYEWSPVLVGMNPVTSMLSTKGSEVEPMSTNAGDKALSEGDDESGGAAAPADGPAGRKPAGAPPFRKGMMVRWKPYRDGVKSGCGMVKSVHTKGVVPGVENDVEATEESPVARVHLHKKDDDGEGYSPMGDRHQGHPVKHLRWMPGPLGGADESADGGGKSYGIVSIKGEYLGDTDEPMAMAALCVVHDQLKYYLMRCVHSDKPVDRTLEMAGGAIDEYRETVLRLFEALLEDDDPEDDDDLGMVNYPIAPGGYPYGYGTMAAGPLASKFLAKLASFDTSRDGAVSALSLEDRSTMVVSAIEGIRDLGRKFAEVRTKEGRRLSAATRTRIQNVLDAVRPLVDDLGALLDETAPPTRTDEGPGDGAGGGATTKADPAAVLAARIEFARSDFLTLTHADAGGA